MRPMIILIALLLAASTAHAASPDQEAIIKVLRDAEAGWNAGDVTAYMAAYWQSDQLRFVSGGTTSYGWQKVHDRYLARYPDQERMGRLVFADLDVGLTGPDHAVVFGSWRLIRAADEPHGLFTLVWQRFPEGWRVIHDHTSSAAD